MLNKKIVIVTVVCLVCTLLFSFSFSTVKADNINLAPIPTAWGWDGFDVHYSFPEIVHYDTSVLHNGNPSIRIDAHVQGVDNNFYREINAWGDCEPGDIIVWSAWIKTGPSTNGRDGDPFNGALIGMDYYSTTGQYIGGAIPPINTWGEWGYDDYFVPSGSDWTYRTITYVVPETNWGQPVGSYALWLSAGCPSHTHQWFAGNPYSTTVPIDQDQEIAWFSETTLYINPIENPVTPTPTPTPNSDGSGGSTYPTPTPTPASTQGEETNEDSINPLFFVVCAVGLLLFVSKDKKRKRRRH